MVQYWERVIYFTKIEKGQEKEELKGGRKAPFFFF